MKIYAISDTHFGHDKLTVISSRPEGFTELILGNLSKQSGDLLIHCGDFCIGNDDYWAGRFLASTEGFTKRILVRGNHDGKSDSWYYTRGFDFVCTSFVHKFFGKNMIFTHIPILKTEKFDMNVHGHLHGNNHRHEAQTAALYDRSWHKDLAPEIHNYKAIDLQNV